MSLSYLVKRGVRTIIRGTGFEIFRLPERKLRRPPLYMKTDVMDRFLYFSRMYEQISCDRRIALLHIDADLYQSYRDVLTTLFPRVAPGGIVLFDEYRTTNWPGAPKAIDEYFAATPYRVQQEARHKKFYLVKGER